MGTTSPKSVAQVCTVLGLQPVLDSLRRSNSLILRRLTDDPIHEHVSQRLVVHVTDNDIQRHVLEKLGHWKSRWIFWSAAHYRAVVLAEERISAPEKSDIWRSVYDRMVNAVITTAISALITLHDKWWR